MAAAKPQTVAVVCVGGPWDRWGFRPGEMERRRDIAAAMGRPFAYEPTGDPLAWRWTGGDVPEPPAALQARQEPPPVTPDQLGAKTCPDCGDPILVGRRGKFTIRLDPEPEPGGLWAYNRHGNVERRTLVQAFTLDGTGYTMHECAVIDRRPGVT